MATRKSRSESSATILATGSSSNAGIVMQGYLLKKKRKMMQGLAKRYFFLSSTGVLSYSFQPNGPIRDSVLVTTSFIHASRRSRAIHIDSGNTVMHCKALTESEFDRWTQAIRGFIGGLQESTTRGGRVASIGIMDRPPVGVEALMAAVESLSSSIQELQEIHGDLKLLETSAQPSPALATASPSQKFNTFLKKGTLKGDYIESRSTIGSTNETTQLNRQLGSAVEKIKSQQALLTLLITSNTTTVSPIEESPRSSISASSLAGDYKQIPISRTSLGHVKSHSRASSLSFASEDTEDYYEDCSTGMGEFVLDEDEEISSSDDGRSEYPDADEYLETQETEDLSFEEAKQESVKEVLVPTSSVIEGEVKRRRVLPCPVSGDEFSMLSMLRKNVGKDLSTISFPVTFNEPLSALQRIAEELEYTDLLHKAAAIKDSVVERMILVVAFAISGSSSNKFRSSRKPFNPLLGETFECIRPDKGFQFISEKVSHHPPVMAFHADSTQNPTSKVEWSIDGHIAPSQKFWGRSFELMFPGNFSVTFHDTGETFSVVKPSSFIRNLVAGTKYLEIVGEMIITSSVSTSPKAIIQFKEGSSWGGAGSRNKIEAIISDQSTGETLAELNGRWDETVDRKKGEREFERIWSVNDFPKNPEKYYGFSQFSTELNEITLIEKDFLPTSDSRCRPDQLALELGEIDEAEETKKRVEEKQRETRKSEVERGGHKPQHFIESEGMGWTFGGDYFAKRAAKELVDVDIF